MNGTASEPQLRPQQTPAFRPAVLIPAYQAERTVGAVVTEVRTFDLPVFVVDDGSPDATSAVARSAGAEVLRHERNRGKGAALRTGMDHLLARGYSHAVTMDADGQHLAREVPVLLVASHSAPEALTIGVRIIGDQAVATVNLVGNRLANWSVRRAARIEVQDTQSGFRVYPIARTRALPAAGDHFEYETTVIIHAARAGMPVRSHAVEVYYPPVGERVSHYRKVVDTLRIIRRVAPLLRRR